MLNTVLITLLSAATPAFAQSQPIQMQITELRRIGSLDGEDALGFVRAMAVAGSRVYAADAASSVLKVFDARGELVRSIGRRGAGPGEFRQLAGVGTHEGSIWAFDPSLRRLTFFDSAGKVVSDVLLRSFGAVAGMRDNGAVIGTTPVVLADRDTAGRELPSAWSVLVQAQNAAPDTIVKIDVSSMTSVIRSGGRQVNLVEPLLQPPLVGWDQQTEQVLVVDPTDRQDGWNMLRFYAPDGTLKQSARLPIPPVRLQNRHVDIVIDNFLGRMAQQFPPGALKDALTKPDYLPIGNRMTVGLDGTTWIGGPDARNGQFTWYAVRTRPRLELIGSVTFEERTEVLWADAQSIWVFTLGELGEPYLVQYSITARR